MTGKIHDIAVIGAGMNGCGSARDAAGRGLPINLGSKLSPHAADKTRRRSTPS